MKINTYIIKSTLCGIVLFNAFFALPALAQTENDEFENLYKCRTIGSDKDRLACYDKVAANLETAVKSGDLVTITKQDVENLEKDSFGFSLPSLPKLSSIFGRSKTKPTDENSTSNKLVKKAAKRPSTSTSGIDNLASPVVSVQTFNRGLTRFHLENGQVWEQTSGKQLRLRIRPNRPVIAHIYRGALSGYRLRVNNKGQLITVRRVL